MLEMKDALTFDNTHLSGLTRAAIGAEKSLSETVRDYVAGAFSENTRRAYRSDLDHFASWGGSIPASPAMIAQYLAAHGGVLSAATLGRRMVAIGKAHTSLGIANPCATDLVRATLRGIRRTHGASQRQAAPLLAPDLLSLMDGLGTKPKGLRDRALLLIGFAGALRRSELVALDVEDFADVPHGIVITLRRSKTDQEAEGVKLGIPFARGRHCPVLAVKEWLSAAVIAEGPVFRPINRHGQISPTRLSSQAVSEIVKARVGLLGFHTQDYSGHSLRAGLATSAAHAGLPSWKIRAQTRHASEAMLSRYIRDGELFRGNVVASLL